MHKLRGAIVLDAEVSLATRTIAISMHSQYALYEASLYISLSIYSHGAICNNITISQYHKYHKYHKDTTGVCLSMMHVFETIIT